MSRVCLVCHKGDAYMSMKRRLSRVRESFRKQRIPKGGENKRGDGI